MQKAAMVFVIALYSQKAGDLLDCIASVASAVAERYQAVQFDSRDSTCFLREQLSFAKKSKEAGEFDLQFQKIKKLAS